MPIPPSRPKRRRWLRAIAWNLLLAGLALIVLGMLALFFITPLGVWAANRMLPAWNVAADRITLDAKGGVTVSGLKVRLREDRSSVLALRRARVTFSWRELFRRHLTAVDLNGLSITANDAAIVEVQRMMAGGDPNDPGWRIDRIAVRDGAVKAALAGRPSAEGRFDAEIPGMAAPGADAKPGFVRLRGLALRSPAGRAIATVPDATLSFTAAELSAGHLRSLVVNGARVALTEEDLALLGTNCPSAGPAHPWRVDDLAIERTGIRFDFPKMPLVEGSVTLHAADLRSDRTGPDSPGKLQIANLSVTPRDSRAAPATLAAATVRFTGSELLAGRIREVRLDAPSLTFNDAWREVVSALGNGGTSAAPGFPLNFDRVIVDGGKLDLRLAGMPPMRGALTARFENAGAASTALQTVEFHDLHFGIPDPPEGTFHEWLSLPKVKITFTLADLMQHHRIHSVDLDGAAFRFDRECRAMFAKPPAAADASAPSALAAPFIADEVNLRNARVSLDDLGLGVPPLDFSLNLDLANVPLNDPLSAETAELQTLELSNINFVSPLDPFVPVLVLPSIFIRWTPGGLRARQLEEIVIVGPAIHVGPDLFWYMDLVEKRRAEMEAAAPATPAAAPAPAWRVKRFSATSGKLVLALDGQARLTLPMPFESHAENLDFQRLSDARLKLALDVPEQDYDHAALDIHLRGLSGKIDFQLPPGRHAENLVQTLKVREVRWKNFRGRDWWLGLTFDKAGIHGDGGGKMCSGEIRAGFTYFVESHEPWTGWVSGTRVDLREITDKLTPGKASMTGRADATLEVNGHGASLMRLVGDLRAPGGGTLRITKLDELIAAIPRDWPNAKRDGLRIGLESLRDFPYTSGTASFWITEPVGQLHVKLDGQPGRRELEVNFNPPGDLNRLFLFTPFKP